MTARAARFCAALLLALPLAGCPADPAEGGLDAVAADAIDAGGVADTGAVADTVVADAVVPDTGKPDTGTSDTTTSDTGTLDIGAPDGGDASTNGPDAADTQAPECTKATDCKGDLALCLQHVCDAGKCSTAPAETDSGCTAKTSGSPCTAFACNAGKCEAGNIDEGGACDDGNPCQADTVCTSGTCGGGKKVCDPCKADADCKPFEDGNPCTGTLFCDKGGCAPNPATVVVCPSGKDTACIKNQCQPGSGDCALTAANAKTPCEDGDKCTANDACDGQGKCEAGDPTKGCVCTKDADCAKHEDGDACNGTLYCDQASGGCKLNKATLVTCPSVGDTACVKNTCDPSSGKCAPTNTKAVACDDDNPCTLASACTVVDAKASPLKSCVGKNQCQCSKDADCAAKEDGNLCNGTLYCDVTVGECKLDLKSVVTCANVDDSECKQNVCAPKTGVCGLSAVNVGKACDDGKACTLGEQCSKAGVCEADANSNVCVCQSDADCAKTDDGDLCNGTPYCDKQTNKCVTNPATIKPPCKTTDDGVCQKSVCQPKTGECALVKFKVGTTCSDGDPCTDSDICDGKGACVGTNQCECKLASDCADDGDKCNGVPKCDNNKCVPDPLSVVTCETVQDTACQKNTCAPLTGKCAMAVVTAAIGKPCDDNNPCTLSTKCQTGLCKGGAAKSCDDKNPCTTDACEPKSDCVYKASGVKICSDGEPCTTGDTCVDKVCKGAKATNCDDGNSCTDDSCTKGKGCAHLANSTMCSDGNACSVGDKCAAKSCVSGSAALACDDKNPCTDDSCAPKTGCVFAPNTKACDDGQPCTAPASCKGGKCAAGAPLLAELTMAGPLAESVHGVAIEPKTQDLLIAVDQEDKISRAWARRVRNNAGKADVVWAHEFKPTGYVRIVAQAAVLRSDAFIVAGSVHSDGTDHSGWVGAVDLAGKELWQRTPGSGDTAERFFGIGDAGNLGVVAVGRLKKTANWDAWAMRYSATGVQLWSQTWGSTKADDELLGATRQGDGFVLVGRRYTKSVSHGLVIAVDATGKLRWQHASEGAATDRFVAGATLSGGDVLVAGYRTAATGKTNGWGRRLGGTDGALIWDGTWPGSGVSWLGVVSPLGDGTVLLAGATEGATGRAAWQLRIAGDGKKLAATSISASDKLTPYLYSWAGDPAGRFAFGGSVHGDGKPARSWVRTVDVWGNTTCAGSGDCVSKDAKTCDDGNGCTTPTCSQGKCALFSNAAPCDDGDYCTAADACSGGGCKGGGPTLHATAHGVPGASKVWPRAIVDAGDGGAFVAGFYGTTNGFVLRTDAAGKKEWLFTRVNPNSGSSSNLLYTAVPDAGGGVLVGGHLEQSSGPKGQGAYLARLDANGKLIEEFKHWGHKDGTKSGPFKDVYSADYRHLIAAPGGGWLGVGTAKLYAGAEQGLLARINADGSVANITVVGHTSAADLLNDGIAVADGYRVTGFTQGQPVSGKRNGWLLHVGLDAKVQKQRFFSASGDDLLSGIAPSPGGGYWVAGVENLGTTTLRKRFVAAFDKDDNKLWTKTITSKFFVGSADGGLYPTSAGMLLVGAASKSETSKHYAWSVTLGTSGTLLWERFFDDGSLKNFYDAKIRLDGTVVAAATSLSLGQAMVVSLDASGNTACLAGCQGKDKSKPLCDDSNACTIDVCDAAKKSCSHSVLLDGAPCGVGKACRNGACGKAPTAGAFQGAAEDMVYVPTGSFYQGANPETAGKSGYPKAKPWEGPQRKVSLSAYWIDRTEVTVAAYAACVKAGACAAPKGVYGSAQSKKAYNYGAAGRQDHPINGVSWAQAQAFCAWRGGRLPTEAEWEMAARGSCANNGGDAACAKSMRSLPWPDVASLPTDACAAGYAHVKAKSGAAGCGTGLTKGVGSTPLDRSPYGCRDMAGNVTEWVLDWVDLLAYEAGAEQNPHGSLTGRIRGMRGGNYAAAFAAESLSWQRNWTLPATSYAAIGFRCALPGKAASVACASDKDCAPDNSCATATCDAGLCRLSPALEGKPCGGGEPCVHAATCAAGRCEVSAERLPSGQTLLLGNQKMSGAAVHVSGAVVIAGHNHGGAYVSTTVPGTATRAGGKTYSTKDQVGWTASTTRSPVMIGDDAVMVMDNGTQSGLLRTKVVLKSTNTGGLPAPTWVKTYSAGAAYSSHMLVEVARTATGLIAVGSAAVGNTKEANRDSWLVYVTPSGTLAGQRTDIAYKATSSGGVIDHLDAVAASVDGKEVAAVGVAHPGTGGRYVRVLWVADGGSLPVEGMLLFKAGGTWDIPTDVTATTDDGGAQTGYAVGGFDLVKVGTDLGWVAQLSPARELAWITKLTGNRQVRYLSRGPAAGVVAAYTDAAKPNKTGVVRLDRFGNTLWDQVFAPKAANVTQFAPTGLVRLSKHRYQLVSDLLRGDAPTGYLSDIHVLSFDQWGSASCASGAGCAAKSCDDGKDCTLDGCLGGTCSHNALSDTACDDDKPCTAGDACKSGMCVSKPAYYEVAWGGTGDVATDATALPDGTMAVVGTTTTTAKLGGTDAVWMKLTPDGKVAKAVALGTKWPDSQVRVASNGDGLTTVSGTGDFGKNGGWVTRLDMDGGVVWGPVVYSDTLGRPLFDVALAPDNSVAVAGFRRTTKNVDQGYIARISATGAKVSEVQIGHGKLTERFYAIARTEGGWLAAGVSYDATLPGAGGKADGWIVRSDEAGKVIWEVVSGASGIDDLIGVTAVPTGVVAVGRVSDGWGQYQAHAIQLDGKGKKLWLKTFGSPVYDDRAQAVLAVDGGVVITGATQSYGKPPGDIGVWRLDTTGALIWHTTRGAASYDASYGIAQVDAASLLIAGRTTTGKPGGDRLFAARMSLLGHATCDEACQKAGPCEDGGPCTASTCTAGKCSHVALAKGCDDADPCTVDACDAKTGTCNHTFQGPCTVFAMNPDKLSKLSDRFAVSSNKPSSPSHPDAGPRPTSDGKGKCSLTGQNKCIWMEFTKDNYQVSLAPKLPVPVDLSPAAGQGFEVVLQARDASAGSNSWNGNVHFVLGDDGPHETVPAKGIAVGMNSKANKFNFDNVVAFNATVYEKDESKNYQTLAGRILRLQVLAKTKTLRFRAWNAGAAEPTTWTTKTLTSLPTQTNWYLALSALAKGTSGTAALQFGSVLLRRIDKLYDTPVKASFPPSQEVGG